MDVTVCMRGQTSRSQLNSSGKQKRNDLEHHVAYLKPAMCLRWVNVKAQTFWEYVKTAAALSSQHLKSRAAEVEKLQSIQQKSLHRKTQYSAEDGIPSPNSRSWRRSKVLTGDLGKDHMAEFRSMRD